MVAVVEGELYCTLQTKRCRRVRSLSLSVTAVLAAKAAFPKAMVETAPLMAWWQRADGHLLTRHLRVVGQAAPVNRVEIRLTPWRVEVAVALEDKGRQELV